MKLPSSSSLLLATLAISSSSSTLAAPAGEGDAAITTSSSNHHISALLGSSDIRDLGSADIDIAQRASTNVESSEIDSDPRQKGLVSAFLELLHTLPMIGHPVASLIEKSFPNGTDSVQRMPDISPDDLQALQAAIAEVARVLNQTLGASSAVQSVAPTATGNRDGLNTDGSVFNGFVNTSAALADPTNTTSSVSPPSAAAADRSPTTDLATFTQTPESLSAPRSSPTSPTIPGNPPNTPVPPA